MFVLQPGYSRQKISGTNRLCHQHVTKTGAAQRNCTAFEGFAIQSLFTKVWGCSWWFHVDFYCFRHFTHPFHTSVTKEKNHHAPLSLFLFLLNWPWTYLVFLSLVHVVATRVKTMKIQSSNWKKPHIWIICETKRELEGNWNSRCFSVNTTCLAFNFHWHLWTLLVTVLNLSLVCWLCVSMEAFWSCGWQHKCVY